MLHFLAPTQSVALVIGNEVKLGIFLKCSLVVNVYTYTIEVAGDNVSLHLETQIDYSEEIQVRLLGNAHVAVGCHDDGTLVLVLGRDVGVFELWEIHRPNVFPNGIGKGFVLLQLVCIHACSAYQQQRA